MAWFRADSACRTITTRAGRRTSPSSLVRSRRSSTTVANGKVRTAQARTHRLAQMSADHRIRVGDPGHGPPDRLADRYPRPLLAVRELARPAVHAGRGRQLGDEPIAF